MKTVVLGGSGFLGAHLIAGLVRAGHDVVGTYRTSQPHGHLLDLPVTWEQADLGDRRRLDALTQDAATVYHVASSTNPSSAAADPRGDALENLSTIFGVIDAVTANDSTLVYVSSGGTVYGSANGTDLIPEDHPLDPISTYGVTKVAVEHHLRVAAQQQGLKYRVARISNPYGPNQRLGNGQGAVGAFLDRVLRGETIELWGDGSVVRDYLFVSDVADALIRLGTYSGDSKVFNIGSGLGTSLLDLIATIELVVGTKIDVAFLGARNFDVRRNVLNVARACKELGWKSNIELADGIERYASWMGDNL